MLAFIKNWERCFLFLDEDSSGTIDYQEMHYAIQSLGFADLSHKLILRLLQKFDRSGSGLIDFDNFILACVTLCRCKEIYEIMCIKFGSTSLPINLEQVSKSKITMEKYACLKQFLYSLSYLLFGLQLFKNS